MDGFGLLIGHLIGDYIIQNDWMAANKTASYPGPIPKWDALVDEVVYQQRVDEWSAAVSKWRLGHLACTVHCVLYTLAVWACSFWWMPWWGVLICFATHWPIDRFRLAGIWMRNVSWQYAFATGPLAPWSIIAVDNTFHLATLFAIALASGR